MQALGLPVIDATCPHVVRAQMAAETLAREGRTVIVVGEKSHPEVEGLCAYAEQAGGTVIVVASADELPGEDSETGGHRGADHAGAREAGRRGGGVAPARHRAG